MLWIDSEDTPGDTPMVMPVQESDVFNQTVQTQADTPNEQGAATPYGGNVLAFTDAVDQTVGGRVGPGNLLGWSDGVLSIRQRWQRLTGLVIQPPRTAELNASARYGFVGLNNHAGNLLAGTSQQEVGSFLPSLTDIARSYTHPGVSYE